MYYKTVINRSRVNERKNILLSCQVIFKNDVLSDALSRAAWHLGFFEPINRNMFNTCAIILMTNGQKLVKN